MIISVCQRIGILLSAFQKTIISEVFGFFNVLDKFQKAFLYLDSSNLTTFVRVPVTDLFFCFFPFTF